ncbi:S9 family peptidase [Planococcus lenghuensis]|uniref:Peptidase n=1 Tax=Planococcus lenghuensis TaxID=2213202 RepID=A0A1Q2L395_9BACL|nr:prolyl oligopeptidase family serine peptidase [Planococcus lenghuensis]AQQ54883.1 peptidase [Planococcus lenghuensis]
MTEKATGPYGSWKSPVTTDLIVQGTTPLVSTGLLGQDLYWVEARPKEAGRNTVMRQAQDGTVTELTPAPYNVRTRVHEYGGISYCFLGGALYFSNFDDNFLYVRSEDGDIERITTDSNLRYADPAVDVRKQRTYWVREDHTESAIAAETTIVVMDTDGGNERIVVSGSDFYSSPRLSPDGSQLAYLTWQHPNMPWDESELWVADLAEDGTLLNAKRVAGGSGESVTQPVWSPDGMLYFASDRSNWWNIMRINGGNAETVYAKDAEFASPGWMFGISDYAFIDDTVIICTYTDKGVKHLAKIDVVTGALIPMETAYTFFSSIHSNGSDAVFIAASPTEFPRIVRMNTKDQLAVIKASAELSVDKSYISQPETIEYPTADGKTAYAFYYRPHNPEYAAPADEKPPLLVHVHGGPTGMTTAILNLVKQYWTSRGFALVDVNYGGSAGFGREYRERLKGNWGITDVEDSANAVRYLIEKGEVDGSRVAISGGSAGGYTTLASLVFTDVYSAGASHFGLSELEVFVKETHKFESRYLHGLIGPYPEAKDVYAERSPINFTDRLSCPVIFFQGLEDKIVLPNQAEGMVEALKEKGLPVAYLAFEGEGHGFRKSTNIKRAIEGEFYFYSRIFGFEPAQAIEPVEILNA